MSTMENFKKQGLELQKKSNDLEALAQSKLNQIEEMKRVIDDEMPEGLDQEILDAIAKAREEAREAATTDIKNVETRIKSLDLKIQNLSNAIQSKIKDNDSAKAKLEKIRGKYASADVMKAQRSIDENSKIGDSVDTATRDAQKANRDAISAAIEKI